MRVRIKRIRRRPAAVPAGEPYRGAAAYPLEARRDELHVFVRRRLSLTPVPIAIGAVVASAVFVASWVAGVVGAIALWWLAAGLIGERQIRIADDVVEDRAATVWVPSLRPALHGAITAVRVRTTFHRAKGEDVERPTEHAVVVRTTRGEHFGLVPPAEPLGAPDLDDPPAR